MTPNIFATRSEIKRAVHLSRERFPNCRVGQAFLNQFQEFDAADREFGLNMWQDDDFLSVVSKIHQIQQMRGAFERI
jgi:hypothetical protein